MHLRKITLILFLLLVSGKLFSQILLIGPAFHYNMGGGLNSFSWGIELSYWNYKNKFYKSFAAVGFDLGVEFEKNKRRVYSEFQFGSLYGVSAGYCYEYGNDYRSGGFQTSIWGAFLAGIDFRYRHINKTEFISPGLFVKLPFSAVPIH